MARTQDSTVAVKDVDGKKVVEVTSDVHTVTHYDRAGVERLIARLDRTTANIQANKAAHAKRCDAALSAVAERKRLLQEALGQFPAAEETARA